MYSPPLQPLSNSNSLVSGDVTIDPSAAIAPGVLLLAEPNSRIVIAAGVCIGMGSIIHARQGTLEVDPGAVLGAGVIVVGSGNIGANACIGSSTTILNSSIQPQQVVSPGSLIGDESRQILETPMPETENNSTDVSDDINTVSTESQESTAVAPTEESTVSDNTSAQASSNQGNSLAPTSIPTYGQTHLNRLLLTLFPHNQITKQPNQDGKTD